MSKIVNVRSRSFGSCSLLRRRRVAGTITLICRRSSRRRKLDPGADLKPDARRACRLGSMTQRRSIGFRRVRARPWSRFCTRAIEQFETGRLWRTIADPQAVESFRLANRADLDQLARIVAASEGRDDDRRARTLISSHPLAIQVKLQPGSRMAYWWCGPFHCSRDRGNSPTGKTRRRPPRRSSNSVRSSAADCMGPSEPQLPANDK